MHDFAHFAVQFFHCDLFFNALVEVRLDVSLSKLLDRVRSCFRQLNCLDAVGFARRNNALQRLKLPLDSVNSVY